MKAYALRAPIVGQVHVHREKPVDSHGQLAGHWVATLRLAIPTKVELQATGATEADAVERLVYTLSTLASEVELAVKHGHPVAVVMHPTDPPHCATCRQYGCKQHGSKVL